MVDFSFIGKEGLIIQYEDIISMIGFNIIKYFRANKANKKAMGMSIQDILLSYINRVDEDPAVWLQKEFGISLNIKDFLDSINTFQPNWLYSYKIIDAAYKNGLSKLIVHSQIESPVIKKFLSTFTAPIEYSHGDIVPILEQNKNVTYITSLPSNIKRCLEVKTPFALTIVDDFMYTADVVINKLEDKLRANNIYVCFTSIISGGLIDVKEE